jgi:hypothetical protein
MRQRLRRLNQLARFLCKRRPRQSRAQKSASGQTQITKFQESRAHDHESIRLLLGNKPEKYSKFRKQCGAIGQRISGLTRPKSGLSEWGLSQPSLASLLALASLEAALRLVDDVNAALAAHDTVVPVPATQRFQ